MKIGFILASGMSWFQKAGSTLCCIVPPVIVVLASSIADAVGSYGVSLYIVRTGTLLYLALIFHRITLQLSARTATEQAPSSAPRSEIGIRINRLAARGLHLTAEETYRLEAVVTCDDSHKVLAARLHVSENALRTSLSRAYTKLGIHSRAEVTRRLIELNMIECDPDDSPGPMR